MCVGLLVVGDVVEGVWLLWLLWLLLCFFGMCFVGILFGVIVGGSELVLVGLKWLLWLDSIMVLIIVVSSVILVVLKISIEWLSSFIFSLWIIGWLVISGWCGRLVSYIVVVSLVNVSILVMIVKCF